MSFLSHICKLAKIAPLASESLLSIVNRGIHTTAKNRNSAYEADGKTKVSILNKESDAGLMINGYSQCGFRLNNGLTVMGPMAIFSRSVLSWNVNTFEDISEKSLSLFLVLDPKIDILILGIGDETVTPVFTKKIFEITKSYKINIEVLRTEQACSTFNFLNSENRMVAAALVPPLRLSQTRSDFSKRKFREKELSA